MAARKKTTRKKTTREATRPKPDPRVEPKPEVEYIAGKRLKISRDEVTINLGPGDPVPEAAAFPRLRAMLRTGAVIEIIDGKPGRWSRRHMSRIGRGPRRARDVMARGVHKAARERSQAAFLRGRVPQGPADGGASEGKGAAKVAEPADRPAATAKKAAEKATSKKKTGTRRRREV